MTNTRKSELKNMLKNFDISEIKEFLEEICEEEEERYDNMCESQQESERGEKMSLTIEYLSNLTQALEDIESNLYDLNEHLNLRIY